MAGLPAGQRAAVALYYLAGLSQAEVAACTGTSVAAVKTRLHKGRARLRGQLWPWWKEARMHAAEAVEMRVADVRRAPGGGEAPARHVIVLQEVGGSRRLPIWVGAFEAAALAMTVTGGDLPRPGTYRFAAGLLEAVRGRLSEVRVDRLAEGVVYAEAVIAGPGGQGRVDARPSDALNLAVLAGVPIRVEAAVLDAAGADAPRGAHSLREMEREVDAYPDGAGEIVAEAKAGWARAMAAFETSRGSGQPGPGGGGSGQPGPGGGARRRLLGAGRRVGRARRPELVPSGRGAGAVEGPGPADRVEAEPLVPGLGPVVIVGHQEHQVLACDRGLLGRPQHDRAAQPASLVLLGGGHRLDLRGPAVAVEVAEAHHLPVDPGPEMTQADGGGGDHRPVDELADRLLLVAVLAPGGRLQGRAEGWPAQLLHGVEARRTVWRAAPGHEAQALHLPAERFEPGREPGPGRVVGDHDRAVGEPGAALQPVGLGREPLGGGGAGRWVHPQEVVRPGTGKLLVEQGGAPRVRRGPGLAAVVDGPDEGQGAPEVAAGHRPPQRPGPGSTGRPRGRCGGHHRGRRPAPG